MRSCVPFLALTGILLTACHKQPIPRTAEESTVMAPIAAMPLARGVPPVTGLAPAESSLPMPLVAVPITLDPSPARYGMLDQAYGMSAAMGTTPPDYAIDVTDTAAWVWRGNDGSIRIAERALEGERQYFYSPG